MKNKGVKEIPVLHKASQKSPVTSAKVAPSHGDEHIEMHEIAIRQRDALPPKMDDPAKIVFCSTTVNTDRKA